VEPAVMTRPVVIALLAVAVDIGLHVGVALFIGI
jgi:hypothetical protein